MSEKKTRTGSENRKRIVKFTARFTEDEAEIVREKRSQVDRRFQHLYEVLHWIRWLTAVLTTV